MNITETKFKGLFEIQNARFEDTRGAFIKTFHSDMFNDAGLNIKFKESYFSISKRGVLRGMHFQLPPHDHAKLVYVTHGEILDVALDIRPYSRTYGQCYSTILSANRANSLYLERGYAHGFLTTSEEATVVYHTTTTYAPEFDAGILWNSFGFDWPEKTPILSERDMNFGPLKINNAN